MSLKYQLGRAVSNRKWTDSDSIRTNRVDRRIDSSQWRLASLQEHSIDKREHASQGWSYQWAPSRDCRIIPEDEVPPRVCSWLPQYTKKFNPSVDISQNEILEIRTQFHSTNHIHINLRTRVSASLQIGVLLRWQEAFALQCGQVLAHMIALEGWTRGDVTESTWMWEIQSFRCMV